MTPNAGRLQSARGGGAGHTLAWRFAYRAVDRCMTGIAAQSVPQGYHSWGCKTCLRSYVDVFVGPSQITFQQLACFTEAKNSIWPMENNLPRHLHWTCVKHPIADAAFTSIFQRLHGRGALECQRADVACARVWGREGLRSPHASVLQCQLDRRYVAR